MPDLGDKGMAEGEDKIPLPKKDDNRQRQNYHEVSFISHPSTVAKIFNRLGDKGMAEGVDTITSHTFTKERQPQAMSESSYNRPYKPYQHSRIDLQ